MARQLPLVVLLACLIEVNTLAAPFDRAELLDARQTAPDAHGAIHRIKLMRVDMKYPLVRQEETMARDSATGHERVTRVSCMVADHAIVTIGPGKTPADLQAVLARTGGTILKQLGRSRSFVVQFGEQTLDTVPNKIASLQREPVVLSAEPDYRVAANVVIPNDPDFSQLWGMNNTGQTGGTLDADIDAPCGFRKF